MKKETKFNILGILLLISVAVIVSLMFIDLFRLGLGLPLLMTVAKPLFWIVFVVLITLGILTWRASKTK